MGKKFIFLFLFLACQVSFAQPKKFDAKFVDSITARLPLLPDDTAKVNNLIVVTRNIADFRSFGVRLLNPFDGVSY